jgi:hypothetical protein
MLFLSSWTLLLNGLLPAEGAPDAL